MRGTDSQQSGMFSYISAERRVPADHPLRAIRTMVEVALRNMSKEFATMYAKAGRPSIAPEKLLRALLLQVLYTVRSERMLMEQLDYNLLFRWFVGLNIDDAVWDATVFTKNRKRLMQGEVAQSFFAEVLAQARSHGLLSTEHFTVDGTLDRSVGWSQKFQSEAGRWQSPRELAIFIDIWGSDWIKGPLDALYSALNQELDAAMREQLGLNAAPTIEQIGSALSRLREI